MNAVANCTTATRIYPVLPKALLITFWYVKQLTETLADTRMYSVYSVTMPTRINKTTPAPNPASLMAAGTPMIPAPIMELMVLKDAPTMPLDVSGLLALALELDSAGHSEAYIDRGEGKFSVR